MAYSGEGRRLRNPAAVRNNYADKRSGSHEGNNPKAPVKGFASGSIVAGVGVGTVTTVRLFRWFSYHCFGRLLMISM